MHTVLAAYLTTALVVGGGRRLASAARPRSNAEGARVMFSMAMGMITVVAPMQILAGDQHGLNTLEHQPAKVMAMEGHFESYTDGAPLILFGWPDEATAETLYADRDPQGLVADPEALARRAAQGPRYGGPQANGRRSPIVFWSFRIMVGLGMADAGARRLRACWRASRHGSTTGRCCIGWRWSMGPAGFVAVIAGWVTTEVGRQPYTVYGLLRTAESVSPLQAPAVATSLLAFIVVYFIVFGAGIFYILRLMSHPPQRGEPGPRARPAGARGRHHAVAGGADSRRRRAGGLTMLTFDLPTIWAFIIAFAVFAYVVMDGFDLGIGILFSWIPTGRERDTAMNSIAPVWDGNETWLVLGGGGLLAAFPLAYGTILSALYAPIIAMLLALIFRGVAFEFRWRDPRHRAYWDVAFSVGSIVAAFAQGVTLGALLQGIAVEDRAYAGGWFDWLTPFSVLVGVEPGLRLCAARRDLADHEERGHAAGALLSAGAGLGIGTIVGHRRGQRGDAVPERRLLASLVRLAAGPVHRAGAAAGRHRHRGVLRQPRAAPQLHAVPDGAAGVRAEPRRPRHQPLSLRRAALDHDLGRRRADREPEVHAGRARWSWCRSSSPTPAIPTGCSAARPGHEGYH